MTMPQHRQTMSKTYARDNREDRSAPSMHVALGKRLRGGSLALSCPSPATSDQKYCKVCSREGERGIQKF